MSLLFGGFACRTRRAGIAFGTLGTTKKFVEVVIALEHLNELVVLFPRPERKESAEDGQHYQTPDKIFHRTVCEGHLVYLFLIF
jgi:hypothetical protein